MSSQDTSSKDASPKDHTPLTWAARITSLLLHPIWLPLVYACWKHWGHEELPKLLLVMTVLLVAFPGIVAVGWMWARLESDLFVMSQSNRIVPLVAGLIGMAFFAVANGGLISSELFLGEMMAILILLLFISIIVTLFWKISLHMLSWGAVMVFAGEHGWTTGNWMPVVLSTGLAIVVAWARMRVKSHDWLQIVVGWGSGVAAGILVIVAFP